MATLMAKSRSFSQFAYQILFKYPTSGSHCVGSDEKLKLLVYMSAWTLSTMHQTHGMCYAACIDVMAWQGLPVSSTNMVLAFLGGSTS